MIWWILLLLVVVGIYMIPRILEKRRRPMTSVEREAAPGKFAQLSAGVTHYRWIGPARGPVAVLIHGLESSSPIWDELAETVADIGYRVLVYDLYNRGFSDSVDGPHDMQLYMTQLDDLLADQQLEDGLTVMGFSMGGMIATEFAATEPHRIHRLILLATSGVALNESDYSKFCRTRPVIGDWVHGVWGAWRLTRQINEDEAVASKPHVLKAKVMEIDRQGFFPAVLSCRRNILGLTQENQHRAVTRDAIPTIAIWGEDDTVVPVSAVGQMAQWNRKAHHEVVAGAGHGLPVSHAKEVGEYLRTMLRDQRL